MPGAVTAFVCAMPMELAPLARRMGLRQRSNVAGFRLRAGDYAGGPVVGAVIGIGPELASDRVGALLDALTVQRVVVVGISGAPDGRAPIGTVVRPDVAVDGETGAEYRPHPLGPAGDGDLVGQLWTSPVLLTDTAAMRSLVERGVVALDMETAAVARVCESRHVPWSVVRAISDRVSDGIVDQAVLELTRPDGRPDVGAAVRYVLERPSRLGGLVRLARDSQRAAKRAAEAAAAALERA